MRLTIIIIEFCSLLDEGTIASECFPDVDANFAEATFRDYYAEVLADMQFSEAARRDAVIRVELLPCPN